MEVVAFREGAEGMVNESCGTQKSGAAELWGHKDLTDWLCPPVPLLPAPAQDYWFSDEICGFLGPVQRHHSRIAQA